MHRTEVRTCRPRCVYEGLLAFWLSFQLQEVHTYQQMYVSRCAAHMFAYSLAGFSLAFSIASTYVYANNNNSLHFYYFPTKR